MAQTQTKTQIHEGTQGKGQKNADLNVRTVIFVGLLGALSFVLMLIRFPLPFTPSFLDFDIAELPGLFAGFFLGPAAGTLVVIVKLALKLAVQGTSTAFVGEAMNLVSSLTFILTASLIYRMIHTRKGAVISTVVATIVVSVVCVILNAYIAFPLYGKLFGLSLDMIVGMGSAANPLVTNVVTLMMFSVFPFNIVKHGVTSLITFLVYKRAGGVLRGILNS